MKDERLVKALEAIADQLREKGYLIGLDIRPPKNQGLL